MKTSVEKRKPEGPLDYIALAFTTFGVGYLPIAPGTWGSIVGIGIYLSVAWAVSYVGLSLNVHVSGLGWEPFTSWAHSLILIALLLLTFVGVWASDRSIELLGNSDPSEAVVDEVIGQLITFLFVPFGIGWPFVFAGFFLFRLFDIWKPYPIDDLQNLPAGIGICADDILAGVYAGVCLSVIYAVSLSV